MRAYCAKLTKTVADRLVVKNMTWLWIVQLANYLLPVLVIPFVTRALGVSAFGEVSYAQNIAVYFSILINFGFDYSATQDVALHRNDASALRTIFRTVVSVKFLFFIVSMFVLLVLYFCFSEVKQSPKLYFWAALFNLGYVLFPNWYFQGMERMQTMSLLNLVIKALGAVLIIWLVRSAADSVLYLFLLAVVFVVVGLVAFVMVVVDVRKKQQAYFYDKQLSRSVIKKSFPVFINNLANSLYWVAGVTIVGMYLTKADVGVYSGSQKLIQACIMLSCMPFTVALFPKVSRLFAAENRQEAWSYYKRILLIGIAIGTLVALCIYIFAPLAVKILLGSEFVESVAQVRMMSLIPLLVIVGTILTVEGLYGLQMQRYAPLVGILAGLVSVGLTLILIPTWSTTGAIAGWYAAQLTEITIVSIILLIKRKENTEIDR